jgi:hypothetical protein
MRFPVDPPRASRQRMSGASLQGLSTAGHKFSVSPLDPPRAIWTLASGSRHLIRRYDDDV